MVYKDENGWHLDMEDPLQGREDGLTMIIDKGLGLGFLEDLLEIAGAYIDIIKLSFGTSFVYPPSILEEKIKMVSSFGIDIYPGGTLFEAAYAQNRMDEFFFRAKELGFTAVEISNGTVDFKQATRYKAIEKARTLDFKVFTEVGKKDRNDPLSLPEMINQINEDRTADVYKILIEARESGRGISIYKEDGSIDDEMFAGIINILEGNEDLILWEAPLKKQQVRLINELGPQVNLGNIHPEEVIALECLRRGLRGDTLKTAVANMEEKVKNI